MTGIYEKGTLTLNDLMKKVRNNPNISKAGAILTFNGIVRKDREDGKRVSRLKVDVYKEMAEKVLNKIKKKYCIMTHISDESITIERELEKEHSIWTLLSYISPGFGFRFAVNMLFTRMIFFFKRSTIVFFISYIKKQIVFF